MNYLWPAIDGIEDAKKACRVAASSAFVVTIITSVATVLSMNGMLKDILPAMDVSSFIDAAIFLILGIFLYRYSRIAAMIALVLYVVEQGFMMTQTGRFNFIAIYFVMTFVSGVRGSFTYQELKGTEADVPAVPQEPTPEELAVKKRQKIARLIVLFIFLIGGGWFLAKNFNAAKNKLPEIPNMKNLSQSLPLPADLKNKIKSTQAKTDTNGESAAASVSLEGSKTFKLKNGKTVKGKIILEDPIYYTVETFGGKQEIVIKEDLAELPE